jgi:hypothetical protein
VCNFATITLISKLADRAEHLPDQRARRVFVGGGQVRPAVGSDDSYAEFAKLREQDFAHKKVASESVRALDEHETHGVRLDVLDQLAEAFAIVQVAGAFQAP